MSTVRARAVIVPRIRRLRKRVAAAMAQSFHSGVAQT